MNASKEYALKAYINIMIKFIVDQIGGNINNALVNAGCKGEIRRVTKLFETKIDELNHEVGEGIDKRITTLAVGSQSLVSILTAFYYSCKNEKVHIYTTWCKL